MIVLDTHVLLWMISGDARLGSAAREVIEQMRRSSLVHVPPIAFWEIGMNVAKGRIALDRPLRDWAAFALGARNMVIAPFDDVIAIEASELADGLHGDPADRIMIATARAMSVPLATADRRIIDYAARGHLQVIDARR